MLYQNLVGLIVGQFSTFSEYVLIQNLGVWLILQYDLNNAKHHLDRLRLMGTH